MKTITCKKSSYDQQNLESARLILQHPEQYGGEEAGLVQWARVGTNTEITR